MAISRTRQNWTPGSTVKVGFMSLEVVAIIPTPGDWMPDNYRMRSANGKRYTFTPHNGLAAGWFDSRGNEVAA